MKFSKNLYYITNFTKNMEHIYVFDINISSKCNNFEKIHFIDSLLDATLIYLILNIIFVKRKCFILNLKREKNEL